MRHAQGRSKLYHSQGSWRKQITKKKPKGKPWGHIYMQMTLSTYDKELMLNKLEEVQLLESSKLIDRLSIVVPSLVKQCVWVY